MAKIIRLYYQAYAIDLKVIYNIWHWRNYYGYSLTDLAFLADINLKLLQSIEYPTLRIAAAILQDDGTLVLPRISVGEYDLDQLDFLRAVFDRVPLEQLVPKLFFADDKISVVAECEAKLAIEIYKHIIDTYKFTPKPIVPERALAFYTAKKKGLRLAKQKPKDGHTVFVKVDSSLRKEGLAN